MSTNQTALLNYELFKSRPCHVYLYCLAQGPTQQTLNKHNIGQFKRPGADQAYDLNYLDPRLLKLGITSILPIS